MKIGPNTTVFIEYDLFTKDKELLESTDGDGKIAYMHGKGMMIEELEKQMEGQSAGDEFAIELSQEEAFGSVNDDLVVSLPKAEFAEAGDISVGDEFQTNDDQGQPLIVRITEINDETVSVDGNHPYAGQDVIFEIKVLEVRETTEEDIKSFTGGHDHSCGCGHDHGEETGEKGSCCSGEKHGDDHECCGGGEHDKDHECCGGK